MSGDLVKRLRNCPYGSLNTDKLLVEAADRIEELEVKLAMAVEALVQIAGKKDYADDPWDIARTTLAELKG